MSEYLLEAKGIIKTFPGVKALSCVDLKVRKGEVHALVGENGAGKSTLMLTLGGIYRPDAGEIFLDGEKVSFNSAQDANEKGISIVYQELSLVPNLSVAENIFANRQPTKAFNMIDWKRLNRQTREMLTMFDIDYINPETLVKDLSIANQQVVEILKAMSFNPKVLILDEPTSSLTEVEVKQLFKNIRILKNKGISFIYISHHLHEIFEIADTITVLRDGEYICDAEVKDIDEDFLVTKMVGRKIENIYGKRDPAAEVGDVLFEAKDICRTGTFNNISFNVRSGEIIGLAGLVGAGRTEIGRAIFGAEPVESGKLFLDGEEIKINSTMEAIQSRIGYMSEDRKTQGLYLNFSIKNNLIANHLNDFSKSGFISEKLVEKNGHSCVDQFCVVTPSTDQIVGNLSGGNQQKVLLATWFGINPRLLIVDEPTRGVDVGAKSDIYQLLRELAKTGVGIIMISSDLPEILGVSDRILVIREGRIAGELNRGEANEERVIALAAGVQSNAKGA
jgi:ABC-type sugar transport system ATPase subunit